MTPLQANAPQTVLDLLFPSGGDSSVAVVPDLLPPGTSEDLDRAAARRTVAAPGSIELIDLDTHQITATQHPAVNLLVDNRPTATVELGVSVVFTISALVAGIRGGRLVAVHSGRCKVTGTLALQDTEVISRQVAFELPGIIPPGRGIALLADHDHPADAGDETPHASVA